MPPNAKTIRRKNQVEAFATTAAAGALATAVCLAGFALQASSQLAEVAPLQLEAKIALGNVSGRIDHMAIDLKRQRLFVAELGNGTVSIIDLPAGKVIQRITGLKEPQGVGFETSTDTLYVASAGDGSVRPFEGSGYVPKQTIDLGGDADNIRIDANANQVIVGYGTGGLALIDALTRAKIGDVRLGAHPEGFQIDPESNRIFVNVPSAHFVVVAERAAQKAVGKWPTSNRSGNFPMALDPVHRQFIVVFRAPAEVGVFDMTFGKLVATAQTCGDADDLFVDAKRGRVYVSCGAGFVDVLERQGGVYRRIAQVPTIPGARTSLFVPELDHLMVAVRATSSEPAAIWVFRPVP
jgi:DNA-binding beta-propeller fold protein YncE